MVHHKKKSEKLSGAQALGGLPSQRFSRDALFSCEVKILRVTRAAFPWTQNSPLLFRYLERVNIFTIQDSYEKPQSSAFKTSNVAEGRMTPIFVSRNTA